MSRISFLIVPQTCFLNEIYFNSLHSDNIFEWSKFKGFADDKINVREKLNFFSGKVENIVGKGENAGNQHFLLFQQCFQMTS